MTATDDDDDRPTTALDAAQMRAMVGKAVSTQIESSVSVVNDLPVAPSVESDASPPVVFIVDKPATVIGGLIKSARSAGQRLVTLSKFRALRTERDDAEAAKTALGTSSSAPIDPLRVPRLAAVSRRRQDPKALPVAVIPPLPDSAFAPPPEAMAAVALAVEPPPEQRVRTHSEMTRPVVLEPHDGPALQVEAPEPAPVRAVGKRPVPRRIAGGVALEQKPILDGYALAALMFVAAAVLWIAFGR